MALSHDEALLLAFRAELDSAAPTTILTARRQPQREKEEQ